MDPISIAGLGLGAASLTVQIFCGCIKGYELYSDAADVPAQYQHLLTRLRIEQTRLLNWGQQIGLLESSLEVSSVRLGFNRNLVNDVLLEIQDAFRACVHIQSKYDPLLHRPSAPANPSRTQEKVSTSKLLLDRVLAISEKSSRATARLQWAMIKKESFEGLVNKLVTFNDRVESFLDRDALEAIRTMQVSSNMMLLQVTDEVSQLRLLVEAMSIAQRPTSTYNPGGLRRHVRKEDDRIEGTVASLARFKAEAALVFEKSSKQVATRISLNEIQGISSDPTAGRSQGHYKGTPIWLEWREQVEAARESPQTQSIVDLRVKQLASLLSIKDQSPLFHSPTCLGYICDERDEIPRYALVYHLGSNPKMGPQKITTLRAMLGSHQPPLGKRIALASAIAESLFYLHAVSWIHKGVCSENILFLDKATDSNRSLPNGSQKFDISDPILSGFDYSRPDLTGEATFHSAATNLETEIYRHPDLLQMKTRRSRKSHDIYSLGIVLLEIVLWKPVEQVVGIEKMRRSRLLEIGQTLSQLQINQSDKGDNIDSSSSPIRQEVSGSVGDEVADLIGFCVTCGDEPSSASSFNTTDQVVSDSSTKSTVVFQDRFFENVVQKLQRIRI